MAWMLEEGLVWLSARDQRMAAAIQEIGAITRPPAGDVFSALALSILQQQISLKAADTVWQRLLTIVGSVTPQSLAACTPAQLQGCGVSPRKAEYLLGAAHAALSGQVDFAALPHMDDESCIRALTALRGVGRWTAEMLLLFSLQRPDIMSYDDFGLRKGLMKLYHHQDMPRPRFERYRRRFAPYGTAASLVLWEIAAGRAPHACAMPLRQHKKD